MIDDQTLSQNLKNGLKYIGAQLGIKGAEVPKILITQEFLEQLKTYLNELAKWNKKINLTGTKDPVDILNTHVLDSVALAIVLRQVVGDKSQAQPSLLDIGSGAGFPALFIKLAFPYIKVQMVDKVEKKVNFLKHVIRQLDLDGIVAGHQVLETTEEQVESYDIVTSRATFKFKTLILLARKYLKTDGHLFAMKGPGAQDEWMGLEAGDQHSFKLEKRILYLLPYPHRKREIWVFKK